MATSFANDISVDMEPAAMLIEQQKPATNKASVSNKASNKAMTINKTTAKLEENLSDKMMLNKNQESQLNLNYVNIKKIHPKADMKMEPTADVGLYSTQTKQLEFMQVM